jgi:hypothetical protein
LQLEFTLVGVRRYYTKVADGMQGNRAIKHENSVKSPTPRTTKVNISHFSNEGSHLKSDCSDEVRITVFFLLLNCLEIHFSEKPLPNLDNEI